ncbi:MAG: hypothetical protein ACI4A5_00145, partial [Hominilimicola sp.]
GNVNMGGSHWYRGTALSGTVTTTGYYSYAACPEVKVDDIYLNTSNGNVYACTTAGSGTAAKWTYQGCIKGATGATGATGPAGSNGTNGKGISSTAITYASSTSGTSAPSSWQTTIPSVSAGSYLWTRTVITYTDGTTSTSYSVARQGANGAAGTDGADGTNAATYVVTKQSELNSAISAMPSTGGKIILREGTYSLSGLTKSNIVFEGMGVNRTIFSHEFGFRGTGTITFRNMTVILKNDVQPVGGSINTALYDVSSLIFENCNVLDENTYNNITSGSKVNELYYGTGDLTFINSNLSITGIDMDQCYSGIRKAGKVCFVGGTITMNSGTQLWSGWDCNLIYECTEFQFMGTHINCTGVNNIKLVNKGRGCFNGGTIILANDKHSISHYDSDTNPESVFTGVYVEYYATYMKFAAISGCTFNHKAAGSSSANQMVLQCPTNMTGNHFKGSAAYINGQSLKHIIDRNLSDETITVGSVATGSITTNNLTY